MSECCGASTERENSEKQNKRERDEDREREGDQRHVEFTITLLGCTVIKAKCPRREREAALGLPSQFSRSLDLQRVAHRNTPPEPSGRAPLFFFFFYFIAPGPPSAPKESAKQAQTVAAPRLLAILEEGGLPQMSGPFSFLMF